MRIKNLMGVSEVRFKNSTPSPWKRSKNHLIRIFLRNGRLRVKLFYIEMTRLNQDKTWKIRNFSFKIEPFKNLGILIRMSLSTLNNPLTSSFDSKVNTFGSKIFVFHSPVPPLQKWFYIISKYNLMELVDVCNHTSKSFWIMNEEV